MWESNAKIYRLDHFFKLSFKYTFIFISINKHVANKRVLSFPNQKYFWFKKKKKSVCFLFYAEKEIENKELFVVALILL